MVIPCQTNYWGISAVPSVHSGDLWLKLPCKNTVSSCWKSSKSPLRVRLAAVCYWLRVRCNSMWVPRIKWRGGLGWEALEVFSYAWPDCLSQRPYDFTQRSQVIHSSAEFSACGSELWCRMAVSSAEPSLSAWCCWCSPVPPRTQREGRELS